MDPELLDALVEISSGLALRPVLERIVDNAAVLTQAPYAALGVLGADGLHQEFVHTGLAAPLAASLGSPPRGLGVLGQITQHAKVLRLDDLSEHPASSGFPPGHPPMKSFLGVPITVDGQAIGNLYLTDKPGGFTDHDEETVVALAAVAAVSVANARLYEESRRRAAWESAASAVATLMLSDAEEDEALTVIAQQSRRAAQADVSALILSDGRGHWMIEIVDEDPPGPGEVSRARAMLGTLMPPDGRAASVITSEHGLLIQDMEHEAHLQVPALRAFGPALYAPMVHQGSVLGALLLLRYPEARPFSADDLEVAERFAEQATVALQLAAARRQAHAADRTADRQRIARDLHDLVIQELFALGLDLNRGVARPEIGPPAERIDRIIGQIRMTIAALSDAAMAPPLSQRIGAEVDRAAIALGFQPILNWASSLTSVEEEALPTGLVDDACASLREALSNVVRHAGASCVQVDADLAAHQLSLVVTDDGHGFEDVPAPGFGLMNLRQRAALHDGGCTITSRRAPQHGTIVRWQAQIR